METEEKTKQSIVFISELPPTFTAIAVKVVQTERNTKLSIVFISETPPTFTAIAVEVVETEEKTKQSIVFYISSHFPCPIFIMKGVAGSPVEPKRLASSGLFSQP